MALTPAEIRLAVDTKLTTLWTAIQTRQATYAAAHNGRYWQGLVTHSIVPADGATALPNIGLTCPTDQLSQPWPLAIRNALMEMSLRVDVYDGPNGQGYVASVTVTIAARTWRRRAQVGNETWRAFGWTLLPLPSFP